MDPITINRLLSVTDAIETRRTENEITLEAFSKIIESQGRVKHLDRRVRDILRIFKDSQWVTQNEHEVLSLTENYHNFIQAWNSGDQLLTYASRIEKLPSICEFS